jgi:DNA gyrase inhibitor GyrI
MRFIREWLPGSRLEPARHPAIELYDTDFTIDPKTFAFSVSALHARAVRRGHPRLCLGR